MTAPYPLWADATEIELRFWEPDAERHDIPDPCVCTHDRDDDHTRTDKGCAVPGCPCPWFDAGDSQPADEFEPEHWEAA